MFPTVSVFIWSVNLRADDTIVYDQMRDSEKRLIQKSIPFRRVSEQCHVSIKELSIFHTSDRSGREEAHVKKRPLVKIPTNQIHL